MSAPPYVPRAKAETVRGYSSPPRRRRSWVTDRPADLHAVGQPSGLQLGHQGPDQGYALRLARTFEGNLVLLPGEREEDALAGAVFVALRRASMFGRAPVIHDLRIALTLYGFLGQAPDDLLAFRRGLFEEVANPHHYVEQRHLVDVVDEESLRLTPDEVATRVAGSWRSLFTEVDAPPPVDVIELERVEPEPEPEPVEVVVVEAEPEPAPVEAVVVEAEPEPAPVEAMVVEPEPEPEVVGLESVSAPSALEAEPEPVALEPEPEPEPSVLELVDEAREAGQLHEPLAASMTDDLGTRDEVRAKAVEAAAKAHRERAGSTEEASVEVASAEPVAPVKKVKKIKKIKKVKKIRKVKRVVKKPAAGAPGAKPSRKASPPLASDEKQAATQTDSLFGRASDEEKQSKKKSASEARQRLRDESEDDD